MSDIGKSSERKASPAGEKPAKTPARKEPGSVSKKVEKPDWANGLKQFYDSVVDEPLPDELAYLLAKLDDGAGE